MDRITFNSGTQTQPLQLDAPYVNAINPTTVFFEQEKVSLFVDALGHIEFFDGEGHSLAAVELPVHKDPSAYGHSAQYGTVRCAADGAAITVFLPVYGWHDSYPHCDGESDRWDRYTARWFRVVFDCAARRIQVLDR